MNNLWGALSKSLEPPQKAESKGQIIDLSTWKPLASGDDEALSSKWSSDKAVANGYEACGWVYGCVDRLARACASVPWVVRVKSGKRGDWVEREDDPIALALEFPSQHYSRNFLISLLTSWLKICGEAYFRPEYVDPEGKRELDGFLPVFPGHLTPIADPKAWIKGYKYHPDGVAPVTWGPDEVIRAYSPSLANPRMAMPPLMSIAAVVDSDTQATLWNLHSILNRAVPDGAFITAQQMTTDQKEEMRDQLKGRLTGPKNARKPIVLQGQDKWLRMGLTPQEMDWLESRKFNLVEICAVLGVPPALLSPDDATYSNLGQSIRYMWEHGALPTLDVIRDALNIALVPRRERATRWITYDTSGVVALQSNLQDLADAIETLHRTGVPLNSILEKFETGLGPVDGGDLSLVDGRLLTRSQVASDDSL